MIMLFVGHVGRVILILMKFGISISTWFQVVPFGLRFSKQVLFLMYDLSFCCPENQPLTADFIKSRISAAGFVLLAAVMFSFQTSLL